jgi:hypothetical protein
MMTLTFVVLVVFIAGFLIGFVPSQAALEQLRADNQQLKRSSSTLQSSLRLAELRGAAGLMQQRVNENNFGAAGEIATGFFNGLRQAVHATGDAGLRKSLQEILLQRDKITTGLAQADPAVKEEIEQLYGRFFHIREKTGEG